MSKIFVIADTHFGDENIRKFENRPFNSVCEMDNALFENWNHSVNKEDKVYLLGDFGKLEVVKTLFKDGKCILNGEITLIVGNHDIELLEFLRTTDIKIVEYPIILDDFWMLSHEPMYVSECAPYANVFGHVHNNPMYRTVSSRSYCVSAERIDYTPLDFEIVKKEVIGYK